MRDGKGDSAISFPSGDGVSEIREELDSALATIDEMVAGNTSIEDAANIAKALLEGAKVFWENITKDYEGVSKSSDPKGLSVMNVMAWSSPIHCFARFCR